MEELLEKIPVEKRWAITAKILTGFCVWRGSKILPSILGTEEGFISPVRGWEKHEEVTDKTYGEVSKVLFQMVKRTFNLPIEDAIGAAKLNIVATKLQMGPEAEAEIAKVSPDKTVIRWTKCAWWERYEAQGMHLEFRVCPSVHQAWSEVGLASVDPKIAYKLTKAMPWGDPYCEEVIEFKEE